MILYDDKHNFLGMSTHTLGFLGYEDIQEFLSMHNDFATLFVPKEGFIYDFDNFNWIDFVLYSGASNKSAIVTLKNGQETQVDLSIKEVHLAHDLGGIKKLYSVKVISDNFHELSGVPKSSDTVGGIGGFSLSGLVKKESREDKTVELETEKSDFQKSIQENREKVEPKNESFVLNIAEDNLVTTKDIEETKIQESVIPEVENDFKLDFFQDDTVQQESEKSSDFMLKQPDNEKIDSDFLLKSDELETAVSKENTNVASQTFEFNLLQEESLPTNFESDTDTDKVENNKFKLDFLESETSETEESPFNSTDNREIIKQIKNDIEEIDTPSEVSESKQSENDAFVLKIPSIPQVEQPMEIEKIQERETFKIKEESDEEAQSSFQIKESKSTNSNKSFTSTLQGLFGNKDTLKKQDSTDDTQDKAFTFNLRTDEKVQTEDVTFQNDTKIDKIEPTKNKKSDEVTFASLSALGLTPDDEFDLLNDFITDAKESIETIEQFTQTKDFDKINYSLVKIKSSAEILNLDAIIDDANSIRKHCITENSEKVIQDTKRLKENIGLLEKRLEATAI